MKALLSILAALAGLALLAPLAAHAAPANDDVSSAIQLNGSKVSIKGNNSTATSEAGEPQHAGVGGGHTVWYRWTAPVSGPAGVLACGPNPSAVIAAYSISGPIPPFGNLNLLGADTGSCGGTDSALVSIPATAGDSYLIAVDSGAGFPAGDFSIHVNAEFPGNPTGADAFADATILNGNFINHRASNAGATAEAGEPTHAGVGHGHSIWFRWTANVTDRTYVFACGTTFAVTAVYTQTGAVPPFTSLYPVAAGIGTPIPTCGGASIFNAQAGQEYLIAIDGTGASDQGVFTLGVQQGDITPGTGVGGGSFGIRPNGTICKKPKKKGSASAKGKKKKGCKPAKKKKRKKRGRGDRP